MPMKHTALPDGVDMDRRNREDRRDGFSCFAFRENCMKERAAQARWMWGMVLVICASWLLAFGSFANENSATNARQDAEIENNTKALGSIMDKLDGIEKLLRAANDKRREE